MGSAGGIKFEDRTILIGPDCEFEPRMVQRDVKLPTIGLPAEVYRASVTS